MLPPYVSSPTHMLSKHVQVAREAFTTKRDDVLGLQCAIVSCAPYSPPATIAVPLSCSFIITSKTPYGVQSQNHLRTADALRWGHVQ